MDEAPELIALLKQLLKREVDRFCRRVVAHDDFIRHTVNEVRRNNWGAVFFGGTLRSLLISRLAQQTDGRPRDIDIVIQGPPLEILRKVFESCVARETRLVGSNSERLIGSSTCGHWIAPGRSWRTEFPSLPLMIFPGQPSST